jgi:hypothetical protein
VTVVAEELQALGVIRYRHGRVEIIDRAGLERTACGCYQSAKRTIDEVYEIVGREGWKPEARRRHFAAPFTTARPRVFARERHKGRPLHARCDWKNCPNRDHPGERARAPGHAARRLFSASGSATEDAARGQKSQGPAHSSGLTIIMPPNSCSGHKGNLPVSPRYVGIASPKCILEYSNGRARFQTELCRCTGGV